MQLLEKKVINQMSSKEIPSYVGGEDCLKCPIMLNNPNNISTINSESKASLFSWILDTTCTNLNRSCP